VTDSLLALYISQDSTDGPRLRETLMRDAAFPVRLQAIEKVSTALSRIDGGGVALVLLDLRVSDTFDNLLQLKTRAPRVPVVVLCAQDSEALAMKAMCAGASGYLLEHQFDSKLGELLYSVVDVARRNLLTTSPATRADNLRDGHVVTFLGAKGGAGTTTVALNVAAALASRGQVILIEMRPTLGTLAAHLRPYGLTRNVSHLLKSRSVHANLDAIVAASVWACKKIPGLSIVFGPQTAGESLQIEGAEALAITEALSRMADHVIVDLPPTLSPANRAVIERSSALALVVERDPVSVQAASQFVRILEGWTGTPQPIGAVIVNRSFVSTPMPLEGLPHQLGCPVIQVIPPDGDLCLIAQNLGTTLVDLNADSLIANSLMALSEAVAPARRPELALRSA
jgi:Flp pilus assembly CpaE family ATPase